MTDTTTVPTTFRALGVADEICAVLERNGITNPFPIQELTLPLAMPGADVIGQARTGTGKTLAFGIPLLQRIERGSQHVGALVIVPTRELCLQVHDDLAVAGSHLGIRTTAIYGGKTIEGQSDALEGGAQVVVGTPGRLLDLRRRGILDLSSVNTLVLDEADEMLDMGFLPDVERLIEVCSAERQTLLFSATMPSEVVGLARRYMRKPTFMRADVEEPQIAPETAQHFLACHRMDKPAVLARVLQAPGRGLCVVFTRTKRMADTLVTELADHGVTAGAIHSNLRQEARERTLRRFREGKVDVLCATEVAARGLDISDVTHVINYDCPDDEKMYLHRIGRTGRAGAAGVAVTLAVWNEQARLEMIKKALAVDVPTHEVFSTSPLLDEIFQLPPREVGKRTGARHPGSRKGGRADRTSRTERAGAEEPRRRQPPSAATPPDQATDEAVAPPEEHSERRRVRRREPSAVSPREDRGDRQPSGVQADAEPGRDERARRTPATPQGSPTGDEHPRVRRRTRSREGTTSARRDGPTTSSETAQPAEAPAPGPPEGTADAPDAGQARQGRDARRSRGRRRRGDSGQGRAGQARAERGPRDGKDASEPEAGKVRKGSGNGDSRERRTQGAGHRRRPDDGGRRQSNEEAPLPPLVPTDSTQSIRGEGRPALTRPMRITHLP